MYLVRSPMAHMRQAGGRQAGGGPAGDDAPRPGRTVSIDWQRAEVAMRLLDNASAAACGACCRRPLLETLRARTARVPLVGLVTDYAAGLLDTLTMYYSYTSPR